jgi:hypothetical protein
MLSKKLLIGLALSWLCMGVAHAQIAVGSSFSGNWYDPDYNGQGLQLQVIGSTAKPEMLASWYTYDASGAPLWLYGQVPITGARVIVPMYEVRSAGFATPNRDLRFTIFGTLDLQFSNCNTGTMRFDSRLGAGTRRLVRLSSGAGSTCGNGLIDSVPSASTSESFLPIFAAAGTANARFRTEPNRLSFRVQLSNAPAGSYTLSVGGVQRAVLNVMVNNAQTEVEFKSPQDAGSLLLDFDPRGQSLALIAQNGSNGNAGGTGAAPPFGNSEVEIPMSASGQASGKLKLRQRPAQVDFSVSLEDVALGSYSVRVGGTPRGLLQVTAQAGRNKGELEFAFPADAGKLLLDFDPRGQLVEVLQGNQLVASGRL